MTSYREMLVLGAALALNASSFASAQTVTPGTPAAAFLEKPTAPGTLLATVDSRPITGSDLAITAEDIGPALSRIPEGAARDAYLLDYRIDSILVVQEALKRRLEQGPAYDRRIAYERNKLLMEALLKQTAERATSEPELRKLYSDLLKHGELQPKAPKTAGGGDAPAATPPSFEEVQDQLKQYAAGKAERELILDLRKTAKIERFDDPTPTSKP